MYIYYIYIYIYGLNSLKCQASFKKAKVYLYFFAEDCNYSRGKFNYLNIFYSNTLLADESRTVFNEMVQDKILTEELNEMWRYRSFYF